MKKDKKNEKVEKIEKTEKNEKIKKNAKIETVEPVEQNEPVEHVINDGLFESTESARIKRDESPISIHSIESNKDEPTQHDEIIKKKKRVRRTKEEILNGKNNDEKKEDDVIVNEDEFIKLENELKTASINNDSKQKSSKHKKDFNLLTGYLLLYLIDSSLPYLISFVAKKYAKIDISGREIKLTKEQFKQIEPYADEVAKTFVQKISPMTGFIVLLGISYFENTLVIIAKK